MQRRHEVPYAPLRRRLGVLGAVFLVALGASSGARAAGNGSTVTVITTADNKTAFPAAISRNGQQIVGSLLTRNASNQVVFKAFQVVNGAAVPIQVPGYNDPDAPSYGTGVNDSGDAVGQYSAAGSSTSLAFYAHAGQVTNLNTALGANSSQATAINNAGLVVGVGAWPDGKFGFVYSTASQTVVRIPNATPSSVNNNGHVVGQVTNPQTNAVQPFFYAGTNTNPPFDPTALHLLGTLGAADDPGSGPRAINDADVIVGIEKGADGLSHATRWAGGATGQAAVSIEPGGSNPNGSAAYGINQAGAITGDVNGAGYYWPAGGTPVSLTDVVAAGENPGAQVIHGSGISDDSRIIGLSSPLAGILIALSVPPVTLQSVAVSPATVHPGDTVNVTLQFSAAVPSGGVGGQINFTPTTGTGAFQQPFSNVPADAGSPNQVTLHLNTTPLANITAAVTGTVSVLFNGATTTSTGSLTVTPAGAAAQLQSLAVQPSTLTGNDPVQVTLTFTAVPPASSTITLSAYAGPTATGQPLVQLPITLPATGLGTTFSSTLSVTQVRQIMSRVPAGVTQVTLVASGSGLGQTPPTTVTVQTVPSTLKVKTVVVPASVQWPNPVTAKLTFTAPIPAGGVTVDATLNVSTGGSRTVSLPVTRVSGRTGFISVPTDSFQPSGHALTATLTVKFNNAPATSKHFGIVAAPPPTLKTATFSPLSVVGGNPVNIKLTFSAPIPAAGVPVTVFGLRGGAAGDPVTVHADTGTPNTGTVAYATTAVTTAKHVTLRVRSGVITKTSPAITLNPAPPGS